MAPVLAMISTHRSEKMNAGQNDVEEARSHRVRRKQDVDPQPHESDLLSHFSTQSFYSRWHHYHAEMLALTRFIYAC